MRVDIQAFVRRWIADGHLSAVMKDEGAERAKVESQGWCECRTGRGNLVRNSVLVLAVFCGVSILLILSDLAFLTEWREETTLG